MGIVNQSNFNWRRVRWLLMVAGIVLAVFGLGVTQPGLFKVLGVNTLNPIFSDLIAILAAGEAQVAGLDVYANNPLDPLNRPHVYGPWWLGLGYLGLVRADAWWLGLLLLGGFILVAVLVLNPRDTRSTAIAVFLLASPPVLLAMERGNNYLVIFLLLAAAVWLAMRPARFAAWLAGGLLVLAAALKLYPLVALPSLAAAPATRKRVLLIVGTTTVVCAIVGLSSLAVYQKVVAMAPEPLTIFGYGGKLTYYMLLTITDYRGWIMAGGLPLTILTLWGCWQWRRQFWSLLPMTGFTTGCYLAGALCWGLCYVSTISFPYRMVLLLLPARLWLQVRTEIEFNPVIRMQWIVTVLLFWTPFTKEHLLVLNVNEIAFTGSPLAWAVLGAEQAFAFSISATLCLAMLGWLWRRFSAEVEI